MYDYMKALLISVHSLIENSPHLPDRPTNGGCSRHGAWSYQLFSAKRARNCLVRSS